MRMKLTPSSDHFQLTIWLALFTLFLLSKAWVSEDAYITARVLDNATNGYGLTWNVQERVQVYTHPLWMLVQLPLYAITQEFFYTTLGLSFTLIALVFYHIRLQTRSAPLFIFTVGFILTLFSLRSVTDYMTSGLETPLIFLLLTLFTYHAGKDKPNARFIALYASLLILTRFDSILLIAPISLHLWYKHRKDWPLTTLLIYSSPLFIWCLFSLFYYGDILPNSFYAKLNLDVPRLYLIEQGWTYLLQSALFDLGGFTLLIISFLACFLFSAKQLTMFLSVFIGIFLHIGYSVYIGGDYMLGRFFAAPIFLALLLYIRLLSTSALPKFLLPISTALCIITAIISQFHVMSSPNVLTKPFDAAHAISSTTKLHDERAWSWDTHHLLSSPRVNRNSHPTDHPFSKRGIAYKNDAEDCHEVHCSIKHFYAIGMAGYYAGPSVHILDFYTISDAFLARIPAKIDLTSSDTPKGLTSWAGHYYRHPPDGYINHLHAYFMSEESELPSSDNFLNSPAHQDYYNQLRYIISGPLWNIERIKSIIDWHMTSSPF